MQAAHRNQRLSRALLSLAASLSMLPLSGCIIAGVSSSGGWFVWPGSIGLTLVVLLILFLLRRR